jgi:multiple sugar transport system substrate-binding protein
LSETAVASSTYCNNATKKRSYYMVPIKEACIPFHIWGSLVEKAGFKLSDAPNTWDAFHDFFKPAQDSLRKQDMRKVYAIGMSLTTVGPNDGNGLFTYFVIANGGRNVVTPDGKLHTDDPQVREAYIKTLTYLTSSYIAGYMPPDVLTWSDSDNNNGFHSKTFVRQQRPHRSHRFFSNPCPRHTLHRSSAERPGRQARLPKDYSNPKVLYFRMAP